MEILQLGVLEKRIDDLTLISAKVDLAHNAKNELVRAKEEIIENLKTIGEREKFYPPLNPQNLVSNNAASLLKYILQVAQF